MSGQSVLHVLYFIAGLAIGIPVHEYAHAWMAVRLGDHTPKSMGRLTLNPRPHIDPFGTLILPGITLLPVLFGRLLYPIFAYAKPTPVNPWNLRKADQHQTLIAVAGPIANLILAFVFGAILRTGPSGQVLQFLGDVLLVQVTLAVLNIVPIPPLDGARILARFLPPRPREVFTNLEQYGALFILLIFFILPGPIFSFVDIIGNGVCRAVAGISCF